MNLTSDQKQKCSNIIKTEISRRTGVDMAEIMIKISSTHNLTIEILGYEAGIVSSILTPFWTLEKVTYEFTNLIDPTWDFIR